MKFYKNLKDYAKQKKIGYCHFIQMKNTNWLPSELVEVPKWTKFIEK